MALKKLKNDGFDEITREAEENGINLSRAADDTFSATIIGGATIDGYDDARALLDDMLAVQAMDEQDDLFAYDNGPMGGYSVAVTGVEKPFEHASLAGAYAMAKASLIPPVAKRDKVAELKKAYGVSESKQTLPPNPTIADVEAAEAKKPPSQEIKNPDAENGRAEAEILSPTRPNGQERAQMRNDDLRETIAQGILDLASQLTTMATSLRASPGTIPFVQKGFEEGEPAEETEAPPPARSRITRERRGK
jgi:hypothetical protein